MGAPGESDMRARFMIAAWGDGGEAEKALWRSVKPWLSID